jgi:hypothetical protein
MTRELIVSKISRDQGGCLLRLELQPCFGLAGCLGAKQIRVNLLPGKPARHCSPASPSRAVPFAPSHTPATAPCGPAFHLQNFANFELYLQPRQTRARAGDIHRVRQLEFLARRRMAEMCRQRDAHPLFFPPAVTI